MAPVDLARIRLASQRLAGARPASPAEAVAWMGAVQAQDRPASLWAIGLRTARAGEADVERAVETGAIVRTWPMRGTLHFVAAQDAHAMVALLASRALPRAASRRRELGLTDGELARSRRVLERALSGGQRLTRPEAYALLEKAGVATREQRGFHILFHLAQEGLLCMDPQEGKQRTVVLLDEWVPRPPRPQPRDEVLAALARRYFASHGPAGVRDFAWWTGLTLGDARAAMEAAAAQGPAGERIAPWAGVDGQGGLWAGVKVPRAPRRGEAHLLPAFDELFVAYKDRSAGLARVPPGSLTPSAGLLSPVVTVDGQAVVAWSRTTAAGAVTVALRWLARVDRDEEEAVARAAQRYADFLGKDLVLERGRRSRR